MSRYRWLCFYSSSRTIPSSLAVSSASSQLIDTTDFLKVKSGFPESAISSRVKLDLPLCITFADSVHGFDELGLTTWSEVRQKLEYIHGFPYPASPLRPFLLHLDAQRLDSTILKFYYPFASARSSHLTKEQSASYANSIHSSAASSSFLFPLARSTTTYRARPSVSHLSLVINKYRFLRSRRYTDRKP